MKSPRSWSPALLSVLREIQRRYPSIDAEIDPSSSYLKYLLVLCLEEGPVAEKRRRRGLPAVQR